MPKIFFASNSRFSPGSLSAAIVGALGGLLSFPFGEWAGNLLRAPGLNIDFFQLLLGSAVWSGSIGLTLGAAILIFDNSRSLRGQWHRDLLLGVPLFFALSFCGGALGQFAYTFVQNSLTRGVGWALMGASIGAGVGLLRRDTIQAARGVLGGVLGGFIGGFIFDALAKISDAGDGALSRLVGQIIMGALIAFLMRVVQDALKNAWLLGISTGPYEGKEYPLNTARVSVGREDSNAIALYREPDLPAHIGDLVFQNNAWFWQGQSVAINGLPQTNAPLNPGDTLQLGATLFRFKTRAHQTVVPQPSIVTPPVIAPAKPSELTRPPRPRALVAPQIELLASTGETMNLPALDAPISIGRASDNAIVLSDAGISSRHARLQMSKDGPMVSDLGSTNGTWVNGIRLAPNAPTLLRAGDKIRFGRLEFEARES